jgi:hypothetical protein
VSEVYAGKQFVGMDVHRRRSVVVRMTEAGERLETVRISNDPEYLRAVMARPGRHPRWCSRQRMGGTGRRIRWPGWVRTCTWCWRAGVAGPGRVEPGMPGSDRLSPPGDQLPGRRSRGVHHAGW